MKKLLLAAAALLGVSAAPAHALVVGTADASNGIPFGSTIGGAIFQQIHAPTLFDDPLGIYRLTYYNTLSPATQTPRTGGFQVYLSTVNTPLATFDTSNGLTVPYLSSSFTKVFDGPLPALEGDRLDLNFSKGFQYDPADGQPMVTVVSFDFGLGSLFLDVDRTTTVTNSRFVAFGTDWNQGLVTAFNAAIPEPGAWALMITGFGMAGAIMRRRRALLG